MTYLVREFETNHVDSMGSGHEVSVASHGASTLWRSWRSQRNPLLTCNPTCKLNGLDRHGVRATPCYDGIHDQIHDGHSGRSQHSCSR